MRQYKIPESMAVSEAQLAKFDRYIALGIMTPEFIQVVLELAKEYFESSGYEWHFPTENKEGQPVATYTSPNEGLVSYIQEKSCVNNPEKAYIAFRVNERNRHKRLGEGNMRQSIHRIEAYETTVAINEALEALEKQGMNY